MKLKKLWFAGQHDTAVDLALLVLRGVAGLAFMFHGWSKIQNPLGWMGPEAFAPPVFQALAALAEFGGGLAWILGLLTRLSALGIGCTMAVAIWLHGIRNGQPFVAKGGGPSYELAAVFLGIALVLFTTGAGRFSVDRQLTRRMGA